MAQAVYTNCGAKCCQCTGCNPSNYKDGLCPKCQTDVKR